MGIDDCGNEENVSVKRWMCIDDCDDEESVDVVV